MHQYESETEKQVMMLLDACPYVIQFSEQPCRISYLMDGAQRYHFPDLLVQTAGHEREFWEVKSTLSSVDGDTVERTKILTEQLREHGYGYRLVILDQLPIADRLKNARVLLKLGRNPHDRGRRESVRRLFAQDGSMSWGRLTGVLGDEGLPMACNLILRGVLAVDLNHPLTGDSLVRWTTNVTMEGRESWLSLVSYKAH